MKHYVVVMQELPYFEGTYSSKHFVCTALNGLPLAPSATDLQSDSFITHLETKEFTKVNAPTIEELWLNVFGRISVFVFGPDGKYRHEGCFDRSVIH